MLYILLGLTFLAGVLIHGIVMYLPMALHQSWRQECMAYLQSINQPETLAPADTLFKIQLPKIKWRRLLPFSSFFWKEKLTTRIRFLTLDIALFVSSLFLFYHFDNYAYWGSSLLFSWALITSSFIDFEHQILPDELTYILLWVGLMASCSNLYTYSTSAILGVICAYLSLFLVSLLFKLIRKKEGIGQGDLKLFAAIAAWVGVAQLPLILFVASLFSLVFILLRKIICQKECSAPASFGPFLAFSGWLVLLWGNELTSYLFL